MLQTNQVTDLVDSKTSFEALSHKIILLTKSCNNSFIKSRDIISLLYILLEATNSNTNNKENLEPTIHPAPNTNHHKQLRFFSTKRTQQVGKANQKRQKKLWKLMQRCVVCGRKMIKVLMKFLGFKCDPGGFQNPPQPKSKLLFSLKHINRL